MFNIAFWGYWDSYSNRLNVFVIQHSSNECTETKLVNLWMSTVKYWDKTLSEGFGPLKRENWIALNHSIQWLFQFWKTFLARNRPWPSVIVHERSNPNRSKSSMNGLWRNGDEKVWKTENIWYFKCYCIDGLRSTCVKISL